MTQTTTHDADVLIIGAGLAGLTAALTLQQRGKTVKLLEATDRPGGRIKTDAVDGYLLDRGFQVLLTEYPETKALLDYDALQLKAFLPGAMVLNNHGKHEIMDPLRAGLSRLPTAAFRTLFSPVGSLPDKINILKLVGKLSKQSVDDIFDQPEVSTLAVIQEYGFSERMLRNFFQPFMAGIFLEDALTTSRREFDFVFKMFAEGDTAVPAQGMEMIPKQLAARLAPDTLLVNKPVKSVSGQTATTEAGEEFTAPTILVATEPLSFVSRYFPGGKPAMRYHSTTNVYLTADKSPIPRPLIALNARRNRLVNNICVMNEVAPAYAPKGKYLISAAINGTVDESESDLAQQVKQEMAQWFGKQTQAWQLLKTYQIEYALPNQDEVQHTLNPEQYRLRDGLYAAGDYLLNGSINAAMRSGRVVGEMIAGGSEVGI